ncbi:THO complex subunit 1 [Paramyrothecium foliicola]|nr:THO complex subunit 1 [Paramyrothecium foliicola]
MPALDHGNPGVSVVADVKAVLLILLQEASAAKQTTTVEPALNKSDLPDLCSRVSTALGPVNTTTGDDGAIKDDASKAWRYGVIEAAARDIFSQFIATTSIDNPAFVNMWNLLDILSILSDEGVCDGALMFLLVEELLDSQQIPGCRKVFDFLESRRERITSKHFSSKKFTLLRSCNELLRRLSRAEDTAFCGRVFIFLFQSFPLGDRSSVNLRGEYHVENITSYETTEEDVSKMDVDEGQAGTPGVNTKSAAPESKPGDKPLEPDSLYPLFWSLQEGFSQPLKLLEAARFSQFRGNLEATIKSFQAIQNEDKPRASKSLEDSKRNLKRKWDANEQDALPEAFNPKYLTSRDLFELEISDLSFRRHVLVQALIILDFLLSLSAQGKEKLSTVNASNKAVMYPYLLNPEDASFTKWANDVKKSISDYLKQGFDGPYFYRMVETVLARDKNWVFWKLGGCPPIQRDPVSPATFVEAKESAQRMATSKRLRPMPMGTVSLDFLRSDDESVAMEQLRSDERYRLPELDTFKAKIADDDFEISMPTNDQTKAAAIAGKSSKSWRALRVAGRFKLAAFDKIDDPKKVDVVFEELVEADETREDADAVNSEEDMPKNREPIIISGPPAVGKTQLIEKLMEQHKGVFAQVVRHTTREPSEGEVSGTTYHFIKAQEFNQLRDGDRLVEYGTRDGVDYGTSSKEVEGISENGKIPVIELDLEAAQFAKDMDFTARYIFIKPASDESLQERLEKSGRSSDVIQEIIANLPTTTDESKLNEVFDSIVVNDDLDSAVKLLGGYIYESEEPTGELTNGHGGNQEERDAEMTEADKTEGGEEAS